MVSKRVLYTKFMTNLEDILRAGSPTERGLADRSIDQYIGVLAHLNGGPFNNLAFLKDLESIREKILSQKLYNRRNTLTAIVSILKRLGSKKDTKLLAHYVQFHDKVADQANLETDKGPSEKKLENYIDETEVHDTFQDLYDQVEDFDGPLTKQQFNIWIQSIAVSLFALQPPRRATDYILMYVVPKIPTDETKNYMDLKNGKMVFNRHKTASLMGPQTIEMTKELRTFLSEALKSSPSYNKNGAFPLLVNFDGKPLASSSSLCTILNAAFAHTKKKVSVNILRSARITNDLADLKKKEAELATEMGHSVETQDKYIVKKKK